MNHPHRCKRPKSIFVLTAIALWALVAGCDTSVEPELTVGEIIRLTLEVGGDESILYSNAIVYNQTGTDQFTRSSDSIHRGFERPRFWENDQDFPSPRTTFESDVVDTAFGTLTFKVGATTRSVPYIALNYGGFTQMVELAPGDWEIFRMRYREARRPNQQGDPAVFSMSVASSSQTYNIVESGATVRVLVRKNSVLTLPVGAASNLTVIVKTRSIDDSLFITYPTAAGFQTDVMNHADSVTHTASVTVESGRRYELLAVQAFKRKAFTDATYAEAAASAVQTAILAFR